MAIDVSKGEMGEGDDALCAAVEQVMKVDLDASDHGSDTPGLNKEDDVVHTAMTHATQILESLTMMPMGKIKEMLSDSKWRPTTPGIAMAAMMRSPDEHPTQTQFRCEESHDFVHFSVAGCDEYLAALGMVLGENPLLYISKDEGLINTEWSNGNVPWTMMKDYIVTS